MYELPKRILLEDEALRDGLQIEKTQLSVAEKLQFIKGLEACGVRRIQVGVVRASEMGAADGQYGQKCSRPWSVGRALRTPP